jgi:hypothetical protein
VKKIIELLDFLITCIWGIYLLVYFLIRGGCIYIRCKITGEGYSEGGHKWGGGFPRGFYKMRSGLRYYKSGEIAVENEFCNRCDLLLLPKELKKLIDNRKK